MIFDGSEGRGVGHEKSSEGYGVAVTFVLPADLDISCFLVVEMHPGLFGELYIQFVRV